jgi:nucleoid DNA-binding protein
MSKKLTIVEIAKTVAKLNRISIDKAHVIVRDVFDTIRKNLQEDRNVMLHQFGSFHRKTRLERKSYSPATKQTITLPQRDIVKFRCGFKVE